MGSLNSVDLIQEKFAASADGFDRPRRSLVHVSNDALLLQMPKETRLCMVLCIVQFVRY